MPAVIDCSPKPSFHELLFIYGPTRYISNRHPNIRNVGIAQDFIFFVGMQVVTTIGSLGDERNRKCINAYMCYCAVYVYGNILTNNVYMLRIWEYK